MTVVDTASAPPGLLSVLSTVPLLAGPPADLPERLPSFVPAHEIKAQLADGTLASGLLAMLAAFGLSAADLPDGAASVRLVEERHRRDSTGLILRVELGPDPDGLPRERILVLHYPRMGVISRSPSAEPALPDAPGAWWYPADPYLPAIADLAQPSRIRQILGSGWQTPDGRPWAVPAGEYSVRRLGYKPGQRASFVLESAAGGCSLMLKTVRPTAFDDLLARAIGLDSSPLTRRIRMPRLVAASAPQGALLYEYLPGRGLDTLTPDELSVAAPFLLDEFVRLTRLIHGTAVPGLPVWSSAAELDKSRLLVEHAAGICRAAEPELRAILARLEHTFCATRSPHRLIHNDFTSRNLLHNNDFGDADFRDVDFRDGGNPGQLAVIDWDSAVIGPVERDVAAFLSSRLLAGDQAGALLGAYRNACGPLDLGLINAFLAHQRLLKACRRHLASGDQERFAAALGLVIHRLDRNPLAK